MQTVNTFKVGDTVLDIEFEDRTRGYVVEVSEDKVIVRFGPMHVAYNATNIKTLIHK